MRLVEFDGVWFAPESVVAVYLADDPAHGTTRVTLLLAGVDGDYAPRVYVNGAEQFERLLALIDPSRLGNPVPPPFDARPTVDLVDKIGPFG